jgi:glucose/arabinose dehydrogenase
MGNWWTSARLVGVAAALTTGAAACGGGGDDTAATTATEASTAAPASTAAVETTAAPATTAPPATTIAVVSTSVVVDTTAPPTTPDTVPTTPVAAPPPASSLTSVGLALEPYADIELATAMAHRSSDPALYVTSQTGEVWRVVDGSEPELVLDLTAEVSPYENGSERGMLGLAFDPADGRMFVYYTDADIDSHIVSYDLPATGAADVASAREVLFIDQPGLGHKGGGMAFDANGLLYIASGDGGASSGRDAQDYSLLLGGILRIAPRHDGPGYDVPPDNPFVGQEGKAPELWAKGLRNPWGFSIDPGTGNLWTGDVGNHTMEEVDRLPAGVGGLNLGWYYVEGTEVMNQGAPADAVAPIFAYRHDEVGPAVIGGRVYRGAAIPELAGAYVFADMSGPFFAVGADDQTVRLDLEGDGIVTGFGTDAAGELYVLTLGAGVQQLVPA